MNRLSNIESALEDFKNGKFLIGVDDEDRENEGDFIIAAEHITPDKVNFMLSMGRGVLCAPITADRCRELDLEMQVNDNTSLHGTPFTITVDLLGEGCTTGVSMHDRSSTIKALTNPNLKPIQLGRPGHVNPLRARDGGVQYFSCYVVAICRYPAVFCDGTQWYSVFTCRQGMSPGTFSVMEWVSAPFFF